MTASTPDANQGPQELGLTVAGVGDVGLFLAECQVEARGQEGFEFLLDLDGEVTRPT